MLLAWRKEKNAGTRAARLGWVREDSVGVIARSVRLASSKNSPCKPKREGSASNTGRAMNLTAIRGVFSGQGAASFALGMGKGLDQRREGAERSTNIAAVRAAQTEPEAIGFVVDTK